MLKRTYAKQMTVQRQEAAVGRATTAAPSDWTRSISRLTIACLECDATFKRLSLRHLREHGLDAPAYRVKYGIPRTQSLAARDTTARRKQIVQQTRPWEKTPGYVQARADKTKHTAAAPASRAKKR